MFLIFFQLKICFNVFIRNFTGYIYYKNISINYCENVSNENGTGVYLLTFFSLINKHKPNSLRDDKRRFNTQG